MDSNVTTREGQRNIGRFGHKFETSCMSIKVHDLQDYIDKLELISDEIEDLQIQEQLLERLSGVYMNEFIQISQNIMIFKYVRKYLWIRLATSLLCHHQVKQSMNVLKNLKIETKKLPHMQKKPNSR